MIIKVILIGVLFELFLLNIVMADNKVMFEYEMLTLSSVDSPEKPGLYQDVSFKYTEKGEWLLIDFKEGIEISEKELSSVELIQTDSFPVQVFLKINGTFISSCPEVGQVRYSLIDHTLEVFIYYKYSDGFLADEVNCGAAMVPYTKIIPISVYSLKQGDYKYIVNNRFTGTFSLVKDNNL